MTTSIIKLDESVEKTLWKKYKKTKDQAIREKLILQYYPLVKYVADKVFKTLPQNVEFDDLVGYGVFGLIDAVEKYDPSRNIKFKTYATTRIKGSMYDEVRGFDWLPRRIKKKLKETDSMINEIENKDQKIPSFKDLANKLNIKSRDLITILLLLESSLIISADKNINRNHDYRDYRVDNTLLSFIKGPESFNPETQIIKKITSSQIFETIESLSTRGKTVLILYYYEHLKLKEIGEILGVSASRICQLKKEAIEKLKKIIEKKWGELILN